MHRETRQDWRTWRWEKEGTMAASLSYSRPLFTRRFSMHGRCHNSPRLNEFSGVILSCFALYRQTSWTEVLLSCTGRLAQTIVQGNCLFEVVGQGKCEHTPDALVVLFVSAAFSCIVSDNVQWRIAFGIFRNGLIAPQGYVETEKLMLVGVISSLLLCTMFRSFGRTRVNRSEVSW